MWADPERVFTGAAATHRHVFWIDAGVEARDGWSWVGIGEPVDPAEVREVALTTTTTSTPAWVGWWDYDGGAVRAGARIDDAATDGRWLRVAAAVGFDHGRGEIVLVGAEAESLLTAAVTREPEAPPGAPRVEARDSPDEYAALIERCRDAIRAGDAYQLCLTTRFGLDGPIDAVDAYRRLRRSARTGHGRFIRIGDMALACGSPERFLEVRDGVVRTSPIKGTRPRGATAAEDAALVAELRASEKERAENVMIVDLVRNDLARVCDPATVTVESLLEVESYPDVHQLVSTVSGHIRDGVDVGRLLTATFPAGSMTGAPKLSAIELLADRERGPRGVYAGCAGWVSADGAVDLAMVIRSLVTEPAGAYVGAGGGITWLSDPRAEVAEVGIKARGVLTAVGAALPPGW